MDQPRKKSSKLGIYILQRQIGKGGMGTVYLALDPPLQRQVAIKVLPTELARDPEYVARFEREATSLAKIRHPNLMHIYAVGYDVGHHYFVMEYIQGKTVIDVLRERGAFPFGYALRILGQVLSALDKVHASGIVHRDLKPGNIMIDEDDRAILMDFGLAKPQYDRSVTTDHTIIGTPEYMAPEVAEGQDADARSDLYAVGIVLYEMVTGQVPFRGPSAIATLRQHVEQPVPSARRIVPDLPPRLDAILGKVLAKKPDDRYPSVRAFAADLLTVASTPELAALAAPSEGDTSAPTLPIAASAVPTAATLPRPLRHRRARARHWGPTAAVLAVVLAVLVGAIILLISRGREPSTAGPLTRLGGLVTYTPEVPPTPAPTTKTAASPQPAASKRVYTIYLRGEPPVRGRLLSIRGDKDHIRVLTDKGEVQLVGYTKVLRIEPEGGK